MEIHDIKKEEKKGVITTIRLTKEQKTFAEKNNISLGKLVRKALEDLMNGN